MSAAPPNLYQRGFRHELFRTYIYVSTSAAACDKSLVTMATRRTEDLVVTVTITDKGASGFALPGGTSHILVRIPFELAVRLSGSQNPGYNHFKISQRFVDTALATMGHIEVTNVLRTVDSGEIVPVTIEPSKLVNPDWTDEDGVQAWKLS